MEIERCPSFWWLSSSLSLTNTHLYPFIHWWALRLFPQLEDMMLSKISQTIQLSSIAQSCLTATPWTAACQASLSITNTWSLLKLMSIESVIPCNHLILCCPLLLLSSVFPSIRVFSNESVLHIRWPKYWEFQLCHKISNSTVSPFMQKMTRFSL